ncbi:hypothetical protein GCM10009767_20580 [Kocuria aegyptia]|uniref:Uncharacterized protein n=1 Tax=Kocuria aegyptia TaxID=330943 RepID=A0ABN2KP38_9MICC
MREALHSAGGWSLLHTVITGTVVLVPMVITGAVGQGGWKGPAVDPEVFPCVSETELSWRPVPRGGFPTPLQVGDVVRFPAGVQRNGWTCWGIYSW